MIRAVGRLLSDPKETVVLLRLLVLGALAVLGLAERPEHAGVFWSVVIAYAATNLLYLLPHASAFASNRAQSFVFVLDAVVVSVLVVARGSQVPELLIAYFSLAIVGAIAQGVGSALLDALLVSALYAAATQWGRPISDLVATPRLAQFGFFFAIALFMGGLADLARRATRERAATEAVNTRLGAAVEEKTRALRASLEDLAAARSRLQASDRLATIGMLSAGIAHEIRNPLAALKAALEEGGEVLGEVEDADLPEGTRGRLRIARVALDDAGAAARQLVRVAEDLTTVARSAPTPPVAVDVRGALEGALRLLKHRARAKVNARIVCSATRKALADPARLQQVLLNLASNAFDAMEADGGLLTLGGEDAPGGGVRITVEDTGHGMPPDVAARAFEAFFTTKGAGRGTGLGLHLVQEIVAAHGGSVTFTTQPGRGTKFVVDWPAAPVAVAALESAHVGA